MMRNKYGVLAIVVFGVATTVSCKKDYTCECTVRIYNPYLNTNTTEKVTDKFYATENTAEGKCKDMERQMDTSNYIYVTCVSFK
jgi:hypothetical protein